MKKTRGAYRQVGAAIALAISLLLAASGCDSPPKNTSPVPGQKAIDKAKDVEDTLKERNEKQQEQEEEQE